MFTDERSKTLHEIEQAIALVQAQITIATPESITGLATRLAELVHDRDEARRLPLHTYHCATCGPDKEGKRHTFQSASRSVLEVRAIVEHDEDGTVTHEQKFTREPMFLVICPCCKDDLQLREYLERWEN